MPNVTTVTEALEVGGIPLVVERPEDPEALIDENRFAEDEFLPYWAERWPSGLALAEYVARVGLCGESPQSRSRTPSRMLELGCGLGLPSLVAARLGAHVVATDWSEDAIRLLESNAERNGAPLTGIRTDWRDRESIAALGPFDLVVAADVLYEERNVAPILALLEVLAAPAVIADPGRRHAPAFIDAARRRGRAIVCERDALIPSGGIYRLEPVRRS